jgi:hypothetical protein
MIENFVSGIKRELTRKATSFRYIDRDWGQLDEPSPSIKSPSLLIDVDSISYETLKTTAGLTQRATASLKVKVIHERLSRSSSNRTGYEGSLYIYRLIDEVDTVLNYYDGEGLWSPLLKTDQQRSNYTGIDCYELSYVTRW